MLTPSKSRVAAISIFASGGMAAAKFVVGVAIGTLALISEALHSSVDVVATVITWLVVRVSDQPGGRRTSLRPRQVREPVGARRHRAALRAGRRHPGRSLQPPARGRAAADASRPFPFVVLLVDIAVNFWRARALHRAARDTKSQALAADALHFASDVLGSFAVIVGLVLAGLGFRWGDAAAAIAVAVMIALLGLRMARSTVETLLDRAPEGVAEKADAAIRAVPGRGRRRAVAGAHGRADPFHRHHRARCRAPIRSTASRQIKRKAQAAVSEALGDADLTFTAVPVARNNESVRERIMVIARNSGLASPSRHRARPRRQADRQHRSRGRRRDGA